MFVLRFAAPALAAAVTLSACGGHGGGSAITPSASGSTSTAAAARGSLALTIKIPHPAASSSTTRHAAYISSSTQSLALSITQGSTTVLQQGVALTPATNPNCTTSGSTTTCTVTIGLAAGSYTGTIATYDGPLVNGTATGNILSQGQSIPLTVTSGNTNTIAATLDGIPASITIAPASGSTITGTQSGGFTVKYTPQPMTIDALDADNNVILGAGAPTFTVTATAAKFSVTQPTANAPNTITLEAVGGGTGTLSVTAAAPDAGFSCSTTGVVCTASASIATGPHTLYVANNSGIAIYQSTDNITWTMTASQSYNPSYFEPVPGWITADANGNVFVADTFDPYFDIFTPPYTSTPTELAYATGFTEPWAMVVTPSDQLLVANNYALNVYAAPFTGSPASSVTVPGTNAVQNVVLDSANDAIVTTGGSVYLYPSPYTGSPTTISATTGSFAVAIGADNTLFVGTGPSANPGQVQIYASPYTATPTTISMPGEGGQEDPVSLAVDASGNLWVWTAYGGTCPCNDYLFKFSKPFSSSSTPSIALNVGQSSYAYEIATDTTGDVIVPTDSGTISIINGSGTTVGTITNGVSYPNEVYYVK